MELVTCDTDCFGGVIGKGEWEREKVKERNWAGGDFSRPPAPPFLSLPNQYLLRSLLVILQSLSVSSALLFL